MPPVPAHHRRTGLCPTLATPTRQRDGLLLRVPLVGGALDATQLRQVADVADRWGNGVVELTNRANLQVRGLEVADAAIDACAAVGLGRPDAALVSISPFANPSGHTLRARLVDALAGVDMTRLSPKFVVHVDDGDGWTAARRADVHARPVPYPDRRAGAATVGGDRWLVDVAGFAQRQLSPRQLEEVVATVARRCAAEGPHARAADLTGGAAPVGVAAALGLDGAGWRPAAARPAGEDVRVGVHRLPDGSLGAFAAARLGRVGPPTLRALAELVADGPSPLARVTAGRAFVLAVADASGHAVLEAAAAAGLLVDAADAAVGVVCCVGAAGCWQTECDTLGRAAELIAHRPPELRPGDGVHVSGCDKFCASRAPAALTLVGRPGSAELTRWDGDGHGGEDGP